MSDFVSLSSNLEVWGCAMESLVGLGVTVQTGKLPLHLTWAVNTEEWYLKAQLHRLKDLITN